MRSWVKTGVAAGALLGVLAACATTSPPMHFYVLTAVGSGAGAEGSGSASAGANGNTAAALRVQHVTIPGELDRPQIVRGVAGNQLQISEQDRWAAPLDEMIRRVLNEDLARGGASGVQSGATTAAAPRSVTLEIEELTPAADCSVSVRAAWTAGTASGVGAASQSRGSISFKAPSAANACATADVPAAMSAALGTLSERLREAVSAKSAQPTAPPG